jgi:hypothetical protein
MWNQQVGNGLRETLIEKRQELDAERQQVRELQKELKRQENGIPNKFYQKGPFEPT